MQKKTQPSNKIALLQRISVLLWVSVLLLSSQTVYANPQFSVLDKSIDNAVTPQERLQLTVIAGDWCFDNNLPVSAKKYYEQAVTKGITLKNSTLYAEALTKLASLQENKFTARTQFNEAKSIYEQFNNTESSIADILEKTVWTYDYLGKDAQKTIKLLEEASQIRKKLPYTTKLTETLRALAWLYESKSQLGKAEYYYSQALDEDLKNLGFEDIRVILAMESFAQFFIDFSELNKAISLLNKKLKLHKDSEFPDLYNMGRTDSMLGWVYLQQKNYIKAETHLKVALQEINQSVTKNPDVPHYYSLPSLFDLVYFYSSQSKFEAALPYFQIAKQLLINAGESNIFEHIKSMESDQLPTEGIGSYSWSIKSQFEGIQLMLSYLSTHPE